MNKSNNGPTIAIVMLVLAIGLTGCMIGKNGHAFIDEHCITCLNNPITGKALNYDNSNPDYKRARGVFYHESQKVDDYERAQGHNSYESSSAREPEYRESNISFSVLKPIDIVYLRIKKEFGFYTLEERARVTGAPYGEAKNWLAVAEEFRYEALPGVSYHMRENTGHIYQGVNRSHTIDVQLATNGHGTDVTFTYWVPLPSVQLNSFGNSIKQRALRALR